MKRFVIVIGFLLASQLVFGWEDCPRGRTDCNEPCGLYIDTDRDGLCDHSQPPPSERVSGQVTSQNPVTPQKQTRNYPFLPIAILLVMLYAGSSALASMGKLSIVVHRRIWNVLLLITFLASALLGLLLVLRINTGISINLGFNQLYWHVEAGIAMAIIAFFHLAWHWRYFTSLFKKPK